MHPYNIIKVFITFYCLFSLQVMQAQNIIYVDTDATGIENGSSWTNAYTTLYDALAASTEGDTIWVAEGIYYPEDITVGIETLEMVKKTALYGGFDGTENSITERDLKNNLTILSGNSNQDDDVTNNSTHVLTAKDTTRIDGFIIQDGYADAGSLNAGGILVLDDSDWDIRHVTIANCTFKNNHAEDYGGAIYFNGASETTVENCKFNNNGYVHSTTNLRGGAIACKNSLISIDNCNFSTNASYIQGGAIYSDDPTLVISNCTFIYNYSSNSRGGAIYNFSKIKNSIFTDNYSPEYGGAVYNNHSSHVEVLNCVFDGNIGGMKGGAIAGRDGTDITNCIFINNTSTSHPHDIYSLDTQPVNVTYSRTQEVISGTGNITTDPGFDTDSTYYLTANSPCIDAGDGDAAPATDLKGNGRHDDFGIRNTGTGFPDFTDMGVYEFQQNSSLNGEYTIGVAGDFTSFTEAVDSLMSLGISDSVVFNIDPGTYNEQVVIPEIAGASDSTRITFQGATGDSTDVVLTFSASLPEKNYTLKLDSADYIILKDMSIQANGNTYGRVMHVTGGTNYNRFLSNRFIGKENTSELVYKDDNPATRDTAVVFNNNSFINGGNAVHWVVANNFTFSNNILYQQTDTAFFMKYGYGVNIQNNLIYSNSLTTGIELTNTRVGCSLTQNQVYLPGGGNGMRVYVFSSSDTILIANNHIYINTSMPDVGLEILNSSNSAKYKTLHNTIRISGDNSSSVCFLFDNWTFPDFRIYRNNNFVNMAGGRATDGLYSNSGDYNNLYTTGSSLAQYGNTLEKIQENYNKEMNSVSVNPHFVSDTGYLPTHPYLNNSGTSKYSDSTDIEHKSRNMDAPDMGACEFTPSASPISGTFSIGGTTPDYETIEGAVNDMVINGINGSVIFTLENDTFPETVIIPEITGASKTNTISFTSVGEDTAVIISSDDYTIKLDGADYCRFEQLKIMSENNSVAKTLLIEGGAHNNTFKESIFEHKNGGEYLVYSGTDIDSNNVFRSNLFKNSNYYGIFLYGNDIIPETGNQIIANTFMDIKYKHVKVFWQDSIVIKNNRLINTANYPDGIVLKDCNKGMVANNILNFQNVERANALKVITSDSVKVYYNTVRISPNNTSAALTLEGQELEVKNNILVNENNGYAITCRDSTGLDCDYNALYTASDFNFCEWLGSNTVSFEAWQDSSQSDIHSIDYLPEFLATDDLHTNDLTINYAGIPLPQVTVDYDGDTRDLMHPDIGADEVDLGVPLAGEYHIGSGQTFTNFSEAKDSILQVGITDSVTFLVDSETYTEQVHIPHIPLSGPEKPVIFQSASGNPEDVILEYAAPDTANYVVWLDSAQHISLKNMTIRALDDSIATVIHLGNNAKNNQIEGNIIYGNGRYASAILARVGNNSNNRFVSNIIYGGLNGISLVGDENTETKNNVIQGNTFKNQYQMPIHCAYQKWQLILGNEIIRSNPIEAKWAGIALFYCNGSWSNRSLTANNMISYNANQLSAGILLSGSSYQNVYHNNVNVFGDSEDSRAFNQEEGGGNINVYNNIFSNKANGLVIFSTNPGNINYNYNLLFDTGEKFIYTNHHIEDLKAWQNEGKGSYSIDIDPKFISDTDLHIQETGLFSKGKQLSEVVTDFDGDVRDQANPTIGADVIKTDCTGPLSGEYTIGSSGDYMTISDAVKALISCGMDNTVVFEIAPGTYNEQLNLPNSFTGKTLGDSVVFKSLSGNAADVTITYNATKTKNYILKIDGLDNFILKDITVAAIDTTYGRLLNISGNTKNCIFDGNIFKGIETTEDNDTLALICYTENSTDSMQVFRSNTFKYGSLAVIKNNSNLSDLYKFQNNQFTQQGSGCIVLNHIHTVHFNENRVVTSTKNFDCIKHTNHSDSLIIRKNKVNIQVTDKGSYINTYSPVYLSNNYVSFNTTNTDKTNYLLTVYDNAYLFFNTMVFYGNGYETYFYRAPEKLVQKNNVLANLSNGEIYILLLHTDINSNYNNLYTKSETFGHWSNINTQDSFEEYVDLTGQDANSVSFNPHFLSDTSGHTNQALLNNQGIPIPGITTDIEGNTRDIATPDIGAYEFSNPEFYVGEDIRKCANESHTLHAGLGFDTYNWSTGSDSVSTVIDTTATGMGQQEISVHVTLGDNSYYDTVMVNLVSPHDFLPEKDYCVFPYDDSIKISAIEGYSYTWENGDTTNTTYTLDSYFHVTAMDEYGCEKEDFVTLHYNKNYADMVMPNDTVISGSDMVSLKASENAFGENYNRYSYFWNTGDTTFTINLSADELGTGEHEIIIQMTNRNNHCASSDSILIIVEDINSDKTSIISDKIKVYPNPGSGKLFISSQDLKISAIELITLEGKKIFHIKEVNEVIDLHTKKPGVYFLKIHAGNEIVLKRVILK